MLIPRTPRRYTLVPDPFEEQMAARHARYTARLAAIGAQYRAILAEMQAGQTQSVPPQKSVVYQDEQNTLAPLLLIFNGVQCYIRLYSGYPDRIEVSPYLAHYLARQKRTAYLCGPRHVPIVAADLPNIWVRCVGTL